MADKAPDDKTGNLPPGFVVAERYEIEDCIGTGGMGTVYRARDLILTDERIALKVLHGDLIGNKQQMQRFLREVQLMRRVSHKSVVRTFDVGSDGNLVYFTMELVSGKSLEDMIQDRSFPKNQVDKLIVEICRGLQAIHEAGIIHRDLKPANIIVLDDGSVKITDFGIARPEYSELTAHYEILGSALYIAPEIWLGSKITSSVDLYSLGVMLYELMTGTLPFDGDSPATLMRMHLEHEPRAPKDVNEQIPLWLSKLILRLLAKSAVDRPADANEVIDFVRLHTEAVHRYEVAPDGGVKEGSSAFIQQMEQQTAQSVPPGKTTMVAESPLLSRLPKKKGEDRTTLAGKVPPGAIPRRPRATETDSRRPAPPAGRAAAAPAPRGFRLVPFFAALLLTIGLGQFMSTLVYSVGGVFNDLTAADLAARSALFTDEVLPIDQVLVFGMAKGLAFALVLAAPAVFVGALAGSLALVFRIFLRLLSAQFACGIVLAGYHLLPILRHGVVNGFSLLSAGYAAARQLSEIALFDPVVTVYRYIIIQRGLLVVPERTLPVWSCPMLLVAMGVFALVIGDELYNALKGSRARRWLSVPAAVLWVCCCSLVASLLWPNPGEPVLASFTAKFIVPVPNCPYGVAAVWLGLYAVVLSSRIGLAAGKNKK